MPCSHRSLPCAANKGMNAQKQTRVQQYREGAFRGRRRVATVLRTRWRLPHHQHNGIYDRPVFDTSRRGEGTKASASLRRCLPRAAQASGSVSAHALGKNNRKIQTQKCYVALALVCGAAGGLSPSPPKKGQHPPHLPSLSLSPSPSFSNREDCVCVYDCVIV